MKTTIRQVFENYLMDEQRRAGNKKTTIADIRRHVNQFDAWWAEESKEEPDEPILPIAIMDRRHLLEFRDWLLKPAQGTSVCGANRHIGSIRQILKCAERNHLIPHAPKLERLPHRSVAPKVYLLDEQIDRLWEAAAKLKWPTKDSDKKPLPYSPAVAWRAALVMYRIYGFRTQELVRMERKYHPIQWKHIKDQELTPNPAGHCRCEYGWFQYAPPKQTRFKPDPLVDPLTWYTRAALWSIRPENPDPEKYVFDWILSSTSFRATWNEWMRLADVHPREGSGVDHITPKHLRKTATTLANEFQPGMGEHIVGHAADRSGQSAISARHYNNAEKGVLYTLLNMPYPESFNELRKQLNDAA